MTGAVAAAPGFSAHERWLVRVTADRAELRAEPREAAASVADLCGRARAIAGGAALRNLELAVEHLGRRPLVRLLPDPDDPLHLATVRAGENHEPGLDGRRLQAAMRRSHSYGRPFSPRPVSPQLRTKLHSATLPSGVLALPMDDGQVRSVGTVLAMAACHRREDEARIADVEDWLHYARAHAVNGTNGHRPPGAVLVDKLSRGRLLLITTPSDRPPDWMRAGWGAQNLWLTAVSHGLVASVVGGVLDAPGVRAALATRLGVADYPQLLLRVGWARDSGPSF